MKYVYMSEGLSENHSHTSIQNLICSLSTSQDTVGSSLQLKSLEKQVKGESHVKTYARIHNCIEWIVRLKNPCTRES